MTGEQDTRQCVLTNGVTIEMRNRQVDGHAIREIRAVGGAWETLEHRGSSFDWAHDDDEALFSWLKDRFGIEYSFAERSELAVLLDLDPLQHEDPELEHEWAPAMGD
ncbi:MAG: hypothetical protein AAFV29_21185 [Myxococcota bacterium]